MLLKTLPSFNWGIWRDEEAWKALKFRNNPEHFHFTSLKDLTIDMQFKATLFSNFRRNSGSNCLVGKPALLHSCLVDSWISTLSLRQQAKAQRLRLGFKFLQEYTFVADAITLWNYEIIFFKVRTKILNWLWKLARTHCSTVNIAAA